MSGWVNGVGMGVGGWKGGEWGGRDSYIKLSFLLALCYIVHFQRLEQALLKSPIIIIARTNFLWDDHLMLHPQLYHSTTISQSTFYITVQLVISLSTSLLLSVRKYNTVSEWLSDAAHHLCYLIDWLTLITVWSTNEFMQNCCGVLFDPIVWEPISVKSTWLQ